MTKKYQSGKEAPAKATVSSTKTSKKLEGSSNGGIGGGAKQKILEALGTFYARGTKVVCKDKLTKKTKLSPKTIANTIPKMQREGLLETPEPKMVSLSQKAIESLGDLTIAGTTNAEVQEKIKSDLNPKEVALFDALLDGGTYDKDQIAQKLDYKDGRKTKSFVNLIGKLKSAQIIHYPTKDSISLDKNTCFPFEQ
jgi:DNA-binding transcriptional regulator YhcF (GntR family)